MTETKMVAGWELDVMVAHRVMEWKIGATSSSPHTKMHTIQDIHPPHKDYGGIQLDPPEWDVEYRINCRTEIPAYSSDIAAAWLVVDELRKRKIAFVLGSNGCSEQVTAWFTNGIWALGKQQNAVPDHGSPHLLGSATADTAPLAICLAALATC